MAEPPKRRRTMSNSLVEDVFFDEQDRGVDDIELVVEGRSFFVSKPLLEKHSHTFARMFSLARRSDKRFPIRGCKYPDHMEDFLRCLLGAHVHNDQKVEGILDIGTQWDCFFVLNQCERFLIESSQLPMKKKFELSAEYDLKTLANSIIDQVRDENDMRMLIDHDCKEKCGKFYYTMLQKWFIPAPNEPREEVNDRGGEAEHGRGNEENGNDERDNEANGEQNGNGGEEANREREEQHGDNWQYPNVHAHFNGDYVIWCPDSRCTPHFNCVYDPYCDHTYRERQRLRIQPPFGCTQGPECPLNTAVPHYHVLSREEIGPRDENRGNNIEVHEPAAHQMNPIPVHAIQNGQNIDPIFPRLNQLLQQQHQIDPQPQNLNRIIPQLGLLQFYINLLAQHAPHLQSMEDFVQHVLIGAINRLVDERPNPLSTTHIIVIAVLQLLETSNQFVPQNNASVHVVRNIIEELPTLLAEPRSNVIIDKLRTFSRNLTIATHTRIVYVEWHR